MRLQPRFASSVLGVSFFFVLRAPNQIHTRAPAAAISFIACVRPPGPPEAEAEINRSIETDSTGK